MACLRKQKVSPLRAGEEMLGKKIKLRKGPANLVKKHPSVRRGMAFPRVWKFGADSGKPMGGMGELDYRDNGSYGTTKKE